MVRDEIWQLSEFFYLAHNELIIKDPITPYEIISKFYIKLFYLVR